MARKAKVFHPIESALNIDRQIALIQVNELDPLLNSQYVLQTRYAVLDQLPSAKNRDERLKQIEDELAELAPHILAYESIIAELKSRKEPTPEEDMTEES